MTLESGSPQELMSRLGVAAIEGVPLCDSRALARVLDIQHRSLYRLLVQYQEEFEVFGLLRFQIAAVKSPGGRGVKQQRYALLNFDQACLASNYSQNTDDARKVKGMIVEAFAACRRAIADGLQYQTDWEHAKRVHHDAAAAEGAGRAGGRMLAKWRFEKPQWEQQLADLEDVLQLRFPWGKP